MTLMCMTFILWLTQVVLTPVPFSVLKSSEGSDIPGLGLCVFIQCKSLETVHIALGRRSS